MGADKDLEGRVDANRILYYDSNNSIFIRKAVIFSFNLLYKK